MVAAEEKFSNKAFILIENGIFRLVFADKIFDKRSHFTNL